MSAHSYQEAPQTRSIDPHLRSGASTTQPRCEVGRTERPPPPQLPLSRARRREATRPTHRSERDVSRRVLEGGAEVDGDGDAPVDGHRRVVVGPARGGRTERVSHIEPAPAQADTGENGRPLPQAVRCEASCHPGDRTEQLIFVLPRSTPDNKTSQKKSCPNI